MNIFVRVPMFQLYSAVVSIVPQGLAKGCRGRVHAAEWRAHRNIADRVDRAVPSDHLFGEVFSTRDKLSRPSGCF